MTTENVQYGSNRDLDEIVFENRNKAYGAYDLRKSYKGLLTKAFILGTLLFAIAIILPFAIAKFKEATKVEEKQVSIDLTEIKQDDQILEEKKEEQAAPPPPPKQEEMKIETIKDVIPEPKVNAQNEAPPPTQSEKRDATTSTQTQEGVKVSGYVKPEPAGVPGGTGTAPTTSVPVKVEPKVSHTEVYTEVDQEADFAGGGTGAVRSKFQENFDSSAVEGEGTLKTTISFVVERDGSVSDVKATGSNSDFNREAERAFRAIRGKWNPGKIGRAHV